MMSCDLSMDHGPLRDSALEAMESEYEKLADATGLPVYKFRGDEQRESVATFRKFTEI